MNKIRKNKNTIKLELLEKLNEIDEEVELVICNYHYLSAPYQSVEIQHYYKKDFETLESLKQVVKDFIVKNCETITYSQYIFINIINPNEENVNEINQITKRLPYSLEHGDLNCLGNCFDMLSEKYFDKINDQAKMFDYVYSEAGTRIKNRRLAEKYFLYFLDKNPNYLIENAKKMFHYDGTDLLAMYKGGFKISSLEEFHKYTNDAYIEYDIEYEDLEGDDILEQFSFNIWYLKYYFIENIYYYHPEYFENFDNKYVKLEKCRYAFNTDDKRALGYLNDGNNAIRKEIEQYLKSEQPYLDFKKRLEHNAKRGKNLK